MSQESEYYEDIKLHEKHRSRAYHLTEKEIVDFAKVWEPRRYHVDPEFAKKTQFGGLIAVGLHLLSITWRLAYEIRYQQAAPAALIAGLGLDEVRFITAARPGDILTAELETTSKRESKSDPNVGIVHHAYTLVNQRDEQVLSFKSSALVEKRPKS